MPSRSVKVLHIVGGLSRAGVETWLVQGLPALRDQGYETHFLVHGPGPWTLQDSAVAQGANLRVITFSRNPLLYALRVLRELRRHGPYDIVHCHMHWFSVVHITVAAVCRIPVRIVHSHLNTARLDEQSPWPRKVLIRIARFAMVKLATHKWAVSMPAGRALFGSNLEFNWTIMPVGTDLSQYVNAQALPREELYASTEDTLVVHVGRLSDQKNQRLILQIAQVARSQVPHLRFILVGDGPDRAVIEEGIARMGHPPTVHVLGERDDVPNIMASADIFLFPSKEEGLGLALVEAQCAGLACLISDEVPDEAILDLETVTRCSLLAPPEEWLHELLALTVTAAPSLARRQVALGNHCTTASRLASNWLQLTGPLFAGRRRLHSARNGRFDCRLDLCAHHQAQIR